MENFTRESSQIFSMEVDDHAKATFMEMARWTKFLSILGFIFLSLMVIGGMILGFVLSNVSSALSPQMGALSGIGGIGIALIYIIGAAIGFYPTYMLYKYSTGMKSAMHLNDKQKFNQAVTNLKNTFRYYGIMMIIILGIYGIIILFGIIGAISR